MPLASRFARLPGQLLSLTAAVLAGLWFFPVAWLFVGTLRNGFSLTPYITALTETQLPIWYLNSLVTTSLVTAGVVGIGAMTGYALSQLHFPGRKLLWWVVLASFIIPTQALIISHFGLMFLFRQLNSWGGIVLPQLVAPLAVIVYKNVFDTLPRELREAAVMDSASEWQMFSRVYLPSVGGVTAGLAIITFVGSWNTFLWPFLAVTRTELMTVAVALNQISGDGLVATILAAIPAVMVYAVLHRQITAALILSGGVKG